MSERTAWTAFEKLLKIPISSTLYRAERISETTSFLGASDTGAPTFLVPLRYAERKRYYPSISLGGLNVNFAAECRIREGTSAEKTGTYVVISCTLHDVFAEQCFVKMLYPAIQGLGDEPEFEEVRELVDMASGLFSHLEVNPRLLRGLWGELFVLLNSKNTQKLLSFWRVQDIERYDFSDGDERLEVKTALGDYRSHTFSLEQLRPVEKINVIVASLLIHPCTGGKKICDLVESIGKAVSPVEYRSLLNRVNSTLRGIASNEVANFEFDERVAKSSLRFYRAAEIPSVSSDVPPHISKVHFTVNLSNLCPACPPFGRGQLFTLFN